MAKKSYSPKDIDNVMAALARNEGNVSRTAKQVKVSSTTIRKWRDLDPETYEQMEQETMSLMKVARIEIIQRQVNNLVLAADKVQELLHQEENLDRVANVIKTITTQLNTLTGSTVAAEEKEFVAVFRD